MLVGVALLPKYAGYAGGPTQYASDTNTILGAAIAAFAPLAIHVLSRLVK